MKPKHLFLLLILIVPGWTAYAQSGSKKITLEKIYKERVFSSKRVGGINSMGDGKHYTVNNRGQSIDKHKYADGEKVATLFNVKKTDELAYFSMYEFNQDERMILLTTNIEQIYRHSYVADHFVYDIANNSI
ncbi:S9 family peptidase, partial [Bacteroidota bacterium]